MPLTVSVVTPERELYSGEADFVVARVAGGDIGVLPGHAPFLGALHHERLVIQSGDTHQYVAVHGGFLEIHDDSVSVLTQIAELAEEIDAERARRQKENAERKIAQEDTHENREKLLRATTRIKTAAEAGLLNI